MRSRGGQPDLDAFGAPQAQFLLRVQTATRPN
jgi:hypothetical protein